MTTREALIKSIEETRKGAGGTGHDTFTGFTRGKYIEEMWNRYADLASSE